jgi:hypothetical protein
VRVLFSEFVIWSFYLGFCDFGASEPAFCSSCDHNGLIMVINYLDLSWW